MNNSIVRYTLVVHNTGYCNHLYSVDYTENSIFISNLSEDNNDVPREIKLEVDNELSCCLCKMFKDENWNNVQVIETQK